MWTIDTRNFNATQAIKSISTIQLEDNNVKPEWAEKQFTSDVMNGSRWSFVTINSSYIHSHVGIYVRIKYRTTFSYEFVDNGQFLAELYSLFILFIGSS